MPNYAHFFENYAKLGFPIFFLLCFSKQPIMLNYLELYCSMQDKQYGTGVRWESILYDGLGRLTYIGSVTTAPLLLLALAGLEEIFLFWLVKK